MSCCYIVCGLVLIKKMRGDVKNLSQRGPSHSALLPYCLAALELVTFVFPAPAPPKPVSTPSRPSPINISKAHDSEVRN